MAAEEVVAEANSLVAEALVAEEVGRRPALPHLL